MIRLTDVRIDADSEELLLGAVRSGRLSQGPLVERLEREFAPLCGCEHVIAVSNGTVALVAALQALGVGAGDEVLTSPFTFVATVNAAIQLGASVRFADIRDDDFGLDPGSVRARISAKTQVVIAVHLYGQPCDLAGVQSAAQQVGAALVEDAAQAHGACYGGRRAGSFGALATFSLYATKNLMAGEGGLITTNDGELARKARLIRNQGMASPYEYEIVGSNYRLTELQAAIAVPQVGRLEAANERRRANADRLTAGLVGLPGVVSPRELPGRRHVWHQYTVRITEDARLDRDVLRMKLAERGVETGVFYPRAIYDYPLYRDHPLVAVEPMPTAERVAREVVSLPVHPYLEAADVDRITSAMRDLLDA